MKTSLCRGRVPRTTRPSRFTRSKSSDRTSSRPILWGFIQKVSVPGTRTVACPQMSSPCPAIARMRQARASSRLKLAFSPLAARERPAGCVIPEPPTLSPGVTFAPAAGYSTADVRRGRSRPSPLYSRGAWPERMDRTEHELALADGVRLGAREREECGVDARGEIAVDMRADLVHRAVDD